MDVDIPDPHEHLRNRVQNFTETYVRPRVAVMEADQKVEESLARLMAEQGWNGATYGPEYGGMGVGHTGKTVILKELARESAAAGAIGQAGIIPTGAIFEYGNEEQKRIYLPAIATGDCLPSIAVTESEAGGDILAMQSKGMRDGDDYILNGRKICVGNSHVATVHLVVVRTGPGSDGLSAFLVETDRPGLTRPPHVPFHGLHGFSCGQLVLADCRVPVSNRLGEEGDGLRIAHTASIHYGRPNLAAVGLGIQQAIWEDAASFLRGSDRLRKQQTNQQRAGDIYRRLTNSQTLLFSAVGWLDRGTPRVEELISAKLEIIKATERSALDARDIHGARALYRGQPVERRLRDANCLEFPAGTSDVQRYRLHEMSQAAVQAPL